MHEKKEKRFKTKKQEKEFGKAVNNLQNVMFRMDLDLRDYVKVHKMDYSFEKEEEKIEDKGIRPTEHFVNQKAFDKRLLQYTAGKIAVSDGEFVIDNSQRGAEDTFSIGQPMYDLEDNLVGHIGIGAYNGLNYGFRCEEEIPSFSYTITKPTKFCVRGKLLKTYWQKYNKTEH